MTTVTNNLSNRPILDDFVKTNGRCDEFADAMLLKEGKPDAVTPLDRDTKVKSTPLGKDFLTELFGKDRNKDVTKQDVTKQDLTNKDLTNKDLVKKDVPAEDDVDAGVEFGNVDFFLEADVDDLDDTVFMTSGDAIDEDGAVMDDDGVVEDTRFETLDSSENQSGTLPYANDKRDKRETGGNPVFDQHLRNEGDAIDLEHHDRVPAGPTYPNIGGSLTGPSGQISWGALHDKVVRAAGDGWLEMEELTSLGLSNAAARAILAGEQAVSAGVLMDTFAGEAKLRGGMPISITDQGIDEALSALIHADGPLRGSFDSYAPDGFIAKDDFIELATEAAAYLNEPTPSRRSLGQLFDEIAGGDRRLSEFEFNNMIAGTNADGSFSFEDAGLSIVEQLAVLGPPLTDRWLDPAPDTNAVRNSHGRPAYPFGSSNTIRLGEFKVAASNAMDWTGEFVSPRRVNEAFWEISSWNGRPGISQTESRWAFGSNPSAWDIIDGIRSNSTPRWEPSRWEAPRPVTTSWWKSSW